VLHLHDFDHVQIDRLVLLTAAASRDGRLTNGKHCVDDGLRKTFRESCMQFGGQRSVNDAGESFDIWLVRR
jgi:hypothetical protein